MAYRLLVLLGLLGALASSLASLSACNTVEGFGKDMEAAGDAISSKADETKKEIAN